MFYVRYLSGLLHGDLGFSRSLNRPVSELLKERLPLTLGSLAYGVLGGVSIGLALALLTACWRVPGSNIAPALLAGACLALPAAVIALLFLWMNVPGRWAIALVVFPHVYRYAKNLAGGHLSIAACAGGAGQGTEQRANIVRARFRSRGSAAGRAGGDFGEPGIRRVHSHRSDFGHSREWGNWPGKRRWIATCRCL